MVNRKTALLQGGSYEISRNVICQLLLEAGYPAHIGARLKIPVYGLNDAPSRWWNRIGESLHGSGMARPRGGNCCYVFESADARKTWATKAAA